MKFAVSLAVATVLLLASGARAAEPQPGWWEVKVKINVPGAPREQVSTSCITAEHTKNIATGFTPAQDQSPNCTRTSYKWDGTRITIQVQCKMQNSTSVGDMVYDFDTPTHYTATMTNRISMRGQNVVSVMTMEGRRVGDCPK